MESGMQACHSDVVTNATADHDWQLAAATPRVWLRALEDLVRDGRDRVVQGLLVEQAHLEKKAAAAANRLLFVVPYEQRVQRALSRLAREELVHFERTLDLLRARECGFGSQQPQPYAEALKAGVAGRMPGRLVDELLVSAIIEARSCERMELCAEAVEAVDGEVAEFYRDLVAAERRHRSTYLEIAVELADEATVAERFAALSSLEVAHLAAEPFAPRLHSGWAGLDPTGLGQG
jgi:tRNA-(ms[2]io[6]A)-hydroxylase